MYNAELEGIDGELKLTLEAAATGMLANNLTTEQEGFALDARQGRKLNEQKLDKELVDGMQVTVEEGAESCVSFTASEGYHMHFILRRAPTTFSGDAITGASTEEAAYPTGIAQAVEGDRYYYNGTQEEDVGNSYRCVLGGNEETALWVFDGNLRGIPGKGSVSFVNGKSPNSEGDARITGEDIVLSEEDGTAISASLREKLNIRSIYNALDLEMEGYVLDARQGKALKGLLDGLSSEVGKKLAVANVANNLMTEQEGFALDARQGKALKGLLDGLSSEVGKKLAVANVANNLTTEQEGCALDARQGKALATLANGKASKTTATASLAVASWSGSGPYTQTVSVSGVTANNAVVVAPAPESFTAWGESAVYASAQAAGKLTFTAAVKPTAALTVNVLCIN